MLPKGAINAALPHPLTLILLLTTFSYKTNYTNDIFNLSFDLLRGSNPCLHRTLFLILLAHLDLIPYHIRALWHEEHIGMSTPTLPPPTGITKPHQSTGNLRVIIASLSKWAGAHTPKSLPGINIKTKQRCVVKVLKPVLNEKVLREIKILKVLAGGPNIISLTDLVRESETRKPCLIFELVDNVEHRTLYPTLSNPDIRYYLYQLLKALDFAHSKGIMHRDVKPQNAMIDPKTRTLRLIDWGLADFYHPGVPYGTGVGSRYYKGPELLVGFQEYDYSLDMWSVGCMFAGMIFKMDTLFKGKDNQDQLVKIVQVVGTDAFSAYLSTYSITLSPAYDRTPIGTKSPAYYPRKAWSSFITPDNRHLATPEALDLLDNLLQLDHMKRLTPREAMEHPYFTALHSE